MIKPRIALLMLDIDELGGGGGTERFFADVFEFHRCWTSKQYDLEILTDQQSCFRLRNAGRLSDLSNTHVLDSANALAQALEVRSYLLSNNVSLIHIALISPRYLPFLYLLRLVGPKPAISISAVACDLAHRRGCLSLNGGLEEFKVRTLYWLYFNTVPLSGIYSWYELLVNQLRKKKLKGDPVLSAACCFFVDSNRFKPAVNKERLIVFAARFSRQKKPLLFLDGVRLARLKMPEVFADWRIEMYGRGPMHKRIESTIDAYGLGDLVSIQHNLDMAGVFARSRVFVSTQDYENFSSMSMLEAMSCGNAVIARSVGQTAEFVRQGENGLLVTDSSAMALAEALLVYLGDAELQRAYGVKSREIAVQEQTPERFCENIEKFWSQVIKRRGLRR